MWEAQFNAPVRRVIPTNIGWKKDGLNVMGRGLARQAAQRFPDLAREYGNTCRQMVEVDGSDRFLATHEALILAPVKPLAANPALSWRQPASVDLIRWTAEELARLNVWYKWAVAVPLLGCGNGQLDPKVIYPIMADRLNDAFTLVVLPEERDRL
jgi:hypothetical protein